MRHALWLFCYLGSITLISQFASAQAPANDNFSQAQIITSFPSTTTGTTENATIEDDEPWATVWTWGSVWFAWISTTSGVVQIDTGGSSSDTALAVYEGDTLTSLVYNVENSHFDDTISSLVLFEAQEGTTYQIAVYSYPDLSEPGEFLLNFTPTVGAEISGIVTGTDSGLPLAEININLSRWDGNWWSWISSLGTDPSGVYRAYPLPPGSYRVEFNMWGNNDYQKETFDNAVWFDDGSNIVLTAGSVMTAINATLDSASKISGTVTEMDGTTPIEDILVQAFIEDGEDWQEVGDSYTDTNGFYQIGSLSPGTYRLMFRNWSNQMFAEEAYDNAADLLNGTNIFVGANTIVPGIDASLDISPAISGTVWDSDGFTPIANVSVIAFRWDGSAWDSDGYAETATNGTYTIYPSQAGTNRISFFSFDYDSSYLPQVYNGAPDLDSGTDVVTINGMVTTGIDAILSTGASISGVVTGPDMVTPLEFIEVNAVTPGDVDWNSSSMGPMFYTDSNGFYRIKGLTVGVYRVQFSDPSKQHVGQAYSNAQFIWSVDANDILITNLTDEVTGIDASLMPASMISGRVVSEDDLMPLEHSTVFAILKTTNGVDWVTGRFTDDQGVFMLDDLVSGTYLIHAQEAVNHLPEYFDNSYALTNAYEFVLADYERVTNVTITLLSRTNAAAHLLGVVPDSLYGYNLYYTGFIEQGYRVQETHSLTGGWHDIGSNYGYAGGTNSIYVTSTNSPVFWRIRLDP